MNKRIFQADRGLLMDFNYVKLIYQKYDYNFLAIMRFSCNYK